MDDPGEGVSPFYRFGPYTLVPCQRLLTRDGVPVPLAPKLLDLLCLLVAEAGRLVPRERVIEAVWPKVFVSETNLRQKVWLLRRALKTDGVEYIETVPRQGYRFVAPVAVLQPDLRAPPPPLDGPTETAPPERGRAGSRALLGVANVLLLTLTLSSDRPVQPSLTGEPAQVTADDERRSVALLRLRRHSGDPEDGWITDALTEMLRTELASSTGFRLVPAETVERHAGDLSPPAVLTLSPQSLARVRHIGGDWVVAGALVAAGSGEDAGLRVDLLVQCTKSREIIAAVTESGIRRDLTELAARAGHELRLALAAAQARGRSLP